MQLLVGVVKPYLWGSTTAIPAILGTEETGEPQAEYWLGAHPGGPATIAGEGLGDWLASRPDALGAGSRAAFGDQLPFLMKVLAAERPLSLQAHPTREDAEKGFAAEEAAGVPVDSPERSFKDRWPKPEMIVALGPFEALSGFRSPWETAALFQALGVPDETLKPIVGPLLARDGSSALAQVFLDCLGGGELRAGLVSEVLAAAVRHTEDEGELGEFARLAVLLDENYPGDPSLLAALLLNHVHLAPGEAVYTPPGTLHAYLSGTGIEIMAASDNVLRGGLTSKYVNVPALASCLTFEAAGGGVITAAPEGAGVFSYDTPDPEFHLWRVEPAPGCDVVLPGPGRARILLVVAGHVTCSAGGEELELIQGQSAFLGADEDVTLSGDALAFLAAPGV
jgi:mannose-6-phosphate isomerase